MRHHINIPRLIVLVVVLLAGGVSVGNLAAAEPVSPAVASATTDVCSDSFCVNWSVQGGGLAPMESTSFRLRSTVGQTMAGLFSGDVVRLHSGYWVIGLAEPDHQLYLPLVLRD